MKCYCCNADLSDAESTRRNALTNEFLDMCDECLNVSPEDFLVLERDDLKTETIFDDYEFGDYNGMAI